MDDNKLRAVAEQVMQHRSTNDERLREILETIDSHHGQRAKIGVLESVLMFRHLIQQEQILVAMLPPPLATLMQAENALRYTSLLTTVATMACLDTDPREKQLATVEAITLLVKPLVVQEVEHIKFTRQAMDEAFRQQ